MFSQSDFNGWMNQKYAILQQDADAKTTAAQSGAAAGQTTANAAAQKANAEASLVAPSQAASYNADAELRRAQAGQTSALTGVINGNAGNTGGVGLGGTTDDPFGAFTPRAAPTLGPEATSKMFAMPTYGMSIGQMFQQPQQPQQHLAKGTAKVPGKGDGTVDTVPAELAPGEAVLNRGAAEHIGRDNIKAMNAAGLLRMGMVAPKGGDAKKDGDAKQAKGKGDGEKAKKPANEPKGKAEPKGDKGRAHYVGGHSHVGKGKKSDTPQIDPQMLQQVMSMMGGGGMPQQAQPQPMPGGMP